MSVFGRTLSTSCHLFFDQVIADPGLWSRELQDSSKDLEADIKVAHDKSLKRFNEV
jgi:hypothetical protein